MSETEPIRGGSRCKGRTGFDSGTFYPKPRIYIHHGSFNFGSKGEQRGVAMSENFFWVYNGWAILITVLGPIYMVVDAELRLRKGIFILRSLSGYVYLASIILLFFVSSWIPAALYIPLLTVGISIASIIKHRGLG